MSLLGSSLPLYTISTLHKEEEEEYFFLDSSKIKMSLIQFAPTCCLQCSCLLVHNARGYIIFILFGQDIIQICRKSVYGSPAALCPCFLFQRMWLHHFLMHPVVRNCVQGRMNDSKSKQEVCLHKSPALNLIFRLSRLHHWTPGHNDSLINSSSKTSSIFNRKFKFLLAGAQEGIRRNYHN